MGRYCPTSCSVLQASIYIQGNRLTTVRSHRHSGHFCSPKLMWQSGQFSFSPGSVTPQLQIHTEIICLSQAKLQIRSSSPEKLIGSYCIWRQSEMRPPERPARSRFITIWFKHHHVPEWAGLLCALIFCFWKMNRRSLQAVKVWKLLI